MPFLQETLAAARQEEIMSVESEMPTLPDTGLEIARKEKEKILTEHMG